MIAITSAPVPPSPTGDIKPDGGIKQAGEGEFCLRGADGAEGKIKGSAEGDGEGGRVGTDKKRRAGAEFR